MYEDIWSHWYPVKNMVNTNDEHVLFEKQLLTESEIHLTGPPAGFLLHQVTRVVHQEAVSKEGNQMTSSGFQSIQYTKYTYSSICILCIERERDL